MAAEKSLKSVCTMVHTFIEFDQIGRDALSEMPSGHFVAKAAKWLCHEQTRGFPECVSKQAPLGA